jgi:aryl-alcohol dehydrogenase-like predicted oxidoreductase
MAQPQVCSVISGATRLAQVEANAQAGDWALSVADLEEVGAILAPQQDE